MSFSMAKKFALQNLKANRLLEIPFVLSSGVMLILFNITASLVNNNYVRTRHQALPTLIKFGIVILAIFTFIFVQYAAAFWLKRRSKEFALYGILGLEKKHVGKIISIEFLILFAIIWFVGIVGGYIFGQLCFLFLNFLMRDVSGRLMDYHFSISALIDTTVLVAILYLIIIIGSGLRIYMSTPMELLQRTHKGEGEPKSRIIIMVVGFLLLVVGYGIALFVGGLLSSINYFFVAVLATILATYLLYATFTVFILKAQRNNKSFYTPKRFLSVSGLLYRMKGNAISLASISILSAGVIISLSTTIAIYSNYIKLGDSVMPREYRIAAGSENISNEAMAKKLQSLVESSVSDKSMIKDEYTTFDMTVAAVKTGNEISKYQRGSKANPIFVIASDLEGYNGRTHQNIKLDEGEILLGENKNNKISDILKIGDRDFKVIKIDSIFPLEYSGVDGYSIVVKDMATLEFLREALDGLDINCSVYWDVDGVDDKEYEDTLVKLKDGIKNQLTGAGRSVYDVSSRSEMIHNQYEINGGFLFLGVLIGIIFLTGTVLITYYKQISEGYEDREKYQIMKKLGLSDDLIKKTTDSQICLMFYGPLIVAAIHCIVASKIIFRLLGLFGVSDALLYMICLGDVLLIFALIYFVIFKLTSKVYTNIVR
ncbi:efflux ABC transporter, permease protein [Lachnoanaerobaculum sp. MSX33]|uniref:FtsX-like permease family protein n=1 Tax=Lachnoanaerobaculum sp. MSX33 TaxID=936596 RepID=UPI0003DF89A4|nr:efflux ABC transporter, permease protein [Lachnoanaerobaculum sp. MSX33]